MNKFKDKSWNFERYDTQNCVHNLHSYPAMLTPSMVKRILNEYSKASDIIMDPYVGSGTVIVEAMRYGNKAVYGFDLNSLALLIAKVKSTRVRKNNLHLNLKSVLRRYKHYQSKNLVFNNIPDRTKIEYWYSKNIIKDLSRLKRAIELIENKNQRDFFNVILANVALDASYKRPNEFKMYRMTEKNMSLHKPDVISLFSSKASINIKRITNYFNMLSNHSEVHIKKHDSTKRTTLKDGIIDLIISSPPYGDSSTTVAYGQFSKLGSLWLDYPEIIGLDRSLLGGKKLVEKTLPPSMILNRLIRKLERKDETRANSVGSFFNDFWVSACEFNRVLKPGGKAIFVVGNRNVLGFPIPTDEILSEMFTKMGYIHDKTIIRDIPSKKMPRFIRNRTTNMNKIPLMNQEYIIFLTKGRGN
ncbi:MAG: site-specific DNA-methyltransferase [Nanoarchaeota archaeon]|nr:site-specific DNA-methyltransferase [Nanoarchaeota archaeon]